MAFTGMNTSQASALERKLDHEAQRLNKMAGELRTKVDATSWMGPDARRFKGETWTGVDSAIRNVASALTTAKSTIESQRRQQEAASQV